MSAVTTTTPAHDDRLIAGFAALAISIHILESAVPMPLPGVKPGLANVIVLIVLLRYGFGMAAAVTLLRVVVGSIFIGTFLTPTFLLSLGGALTALSAAGLVHAIGRRWTGPVGYSIAMAVAHMGGQFFLAWQWFVPHPALLNLLPALLAFATGVGIITGIIAATVLQRMGAREP